MRRKRSDDTVAVLRDSLAEWYLACNPTYQRVHYQFDLIIPALERLARRQGKRKLLITAPPGHAKTDITTRGFIPWYLGNHPTHQAMTLSYSDVLAKDFGRDVRNACMTNLARAVFPGLDLRKDSHANTFFATAQGNRYYAVGFDATIAGRRVDLLVMDDPVKSQADAESDAIMDGLMKVYRSVVKHRLRPDAIMVICLTRYGPKDFVARLLDSEADQWDQLIIPAENADGSYLWEEHYGRKHYEDAKIYPDTWWAVYMQQPRAYETLYFDPAWLRYYEAGAVPFDWAHYVLVDPAKSTERHADRTSIVVVAAGPECRLFVRDWVMDRLNPDQRAAAICRMVRRWKPRCVAYEDGSGIETYYLQKSLREAGLAVRLIPVGKKGPRAIMPKHERIRELIPDFAEGRIWLPKELKYTSVADERTVDLIARWRDEEFLLYRGPDSTRHDDGLDSLSRIHEPELHIQYVTSEPDEQIRERPATAGWEAVY